MEEKVKRTKISQTEVPNITLEESLRIANCLWDNFAGKSAAPHQIAMALDLSPTSGGWRNLCGASIAYGLTEGGYNASQIVLTSLGRRIVAPTTENDDRAALKEATLKPRILAEFFQKYNRAKLPKSEIACNLLVEWGLPKERSQGIFNIIKDNGYYVDFIHDTKTGPFVSLDNEVLNAEKDASSDRNNSNVINEKSDHDLKHAGESVKNENPEPPLRRSENNRVFITHGEKSGNIGSDQGGGRAWRV